MFTPFIIRSRSRGIIPSDVSGLLVWNRGDTGLKTGGARQFTAANSESLSIADDAVLDLSTGDVLLGVFVMRDSTGQQTIAAKWEDDENYWVWELTATGELHFIAVVGAVTIIEVNGLATTTTLAQYYHCALALDRDSTANTKFYIDGVADVTGTPTVAATDIDNAGAFRLGALKA